MMVIFIGLPIHAQFQGQEFVQNKGQWPSDVQLMAKDGAAKIWLGSDRFLFQLTDFSALEKAHHEQELITNPSLPSALVQQRFIGANPKAQAQGQKLRKKQKFSNSNPITKNKRRIRKIIPSKQILTETDNELR
jgi:hypothetical protein